MTARRGTIGLFGGTFDPVHFGHLRMALELKQALGLDEMRLLPCGIPPHRTDPVANPERRAAMLRLALADCPELAIDETDLRHPAPAYAVETLTRLRHTLGDDVSLCLAMGMDSLAALDTWHRWRELTDLAHLIVAARPGASLPTTGPVAALVKRRSADAAALRAESRGAIVIQALTLLPISATQIRDLIARGRSPQFLLPDAVWTFIRSQALYGYPGRAAFSPDSNPNQGPDS